jgi:hypothetical protein
MEEKKKKEREKQRKITSNKPGEEKMEVAKSESRKQE